MAHLVAAAIIAVIVVSDREGAIRIIAVDLPCLVRLMSGLVSAMDGWNTRDIAYHFVVPASIFRSFAVGEDQMGDFTGGGGGELTFRGCTYFVAGGER